MNRRSVIELGLASVVVVAAAKIPRVVAQAKLELKASDVHPTGYPTVVAVENFGKKLELATHGRISVKMFPSMQLGGEKEAIEQARVDTIQLARVSVGALGPTIDELNVFSLPFLFRDTAHMQRVVDGPIGQELLDKITNNEKTARPPRRDRRSQPWCRSACPSRKVSRLSRRARRADKADPAARARRAQPGCAG